MSSLVRSVLGTPTSVPNILTGETDQADAVKPLFPVLSFLFSLFCLHTSSPFSISPHVTLLLRRQKRIRTKKIIPLSLSRSLQPCPMPMLAAGITPSRDPAPIQSMSTKKYYAADDSDSAHSSSQMEDLPLAHCRFNGIQVLAPSNVPPLASYSSSHRSMSDLYESRPGSPFPTPSQSWAAESRSQSPYPSVSPTPLVCCSRLRP